MKNQDVNLDNEGIKVPDKLPVLPISKVVLFPSLVMPIAVEEEHHIQLIENALNKDKMFGLFLSKIEENPSIRDIESIGTLASIIRMIKVPDGTIRVLVQGIKRVQIKNIVQNEPYFIAEIEEVKSVPADKDEIEPLKNRLLNIFKDLISYSPYLPDEIETVVLNIDDASNLADFISGNIRLSPEKSQELLKITDIKKQYEKLIDLLSKELDTMKVHGEITGKVQKELSEHQRKAILREQLKAIKEELGEGDEISIRINEYKKKIKKANMSEEAQKTANEELERLRVVPPQAAEYNVIRNYLDWLCELPWDKMTKDNLDISEAERILNEDHHDLEDVKERIIEFLSVRKLKENVKGPILCFVGPPGVGKTSLGQSIARALNRKFFRTSLGGIRDEAEIRGHRRTYVGALPGRIIQSLKRVQSRNPVFMLDEIDKVGRDFRGDPASALLEVLDPEQNVAFRDNFLEVAFDLSSIMFITTANITDTIPSALLDRMEVIRLPGYTVEDKYKIARDYLIPRRIEESGLAKEQINFTEKALRKIITNYTREAGVRNLEREIGSVCRKMAKKVASNEEYISEITEDTLEEYLGPIQFRTEEKEKSPQVGVATGLVWTPAGGQIDFVEATMMKGNGNLILTGKLGEVLQESAKAALSYIRANSSLFGLDSDFFSDKDIHIHIPEGAIPKDGPSGGITLSIALISLFTNKPVSPDYAMTGEITLRGKVLPIGGVKEKILAAKRAGIKKIILPIDNEKDLSDMQENQKEGLNFIFIERIVEAAKEVILGLDIKGEF